VSSSHKRLAVLPHMYEHVNQEARGQQFAEERLRAIDEELRQLAMEKQMWESVLAGFKAMSCSTCHGSGEVGYYPYGMQDGMRFKKCGRCNGSGKP
jgi:hypothetical protein